MLKTQRRQPNVIIVFMDDMGYGDMGCFGSTAIRTPHMDGVADSGIRFTQMYSAAPICTPSRYGILTGRYPQRAGLSRVLFPHDTDGLTDRDVTVASVLSGADYSSCCLGKWHIGCLPEHNPVHHGFDEYFGLLYSNDMTPLHLYRGEEAIETEVDQAQLTRRYTDEAIDFIERHKDSPFLVYLAHTMPHIPLRVEPKFRGRSAAGIYGDTIECIDHHLGRLLGRLEDLGLTDDTLVIVTSDNGPWYEGSTGGLRGRKFDVYEGGIRMPFVAQWPSEIEAGRECRDPASLMDLLPTLAQLAGVDLPDGCRPDGCDIASVLRGGPMPERGPLYHYCIDSLNAVRSGRWKLHVGCGGDANSAAMPQLFDMERDPQESYNVANLYPDIVEELTARIRTMDASVTAERQART